MADAVLRAAAEGMHAAATELLAHFPDTFPVFQEEMEATWDFDATHNAYLPSRISVMP